MKSLTEIRAEAVEALNAAKAEIAAMRLDIDGQHVVVFANGCIPFRRAEDNTIRVFGGTIYLASRQPAEYIAAGLRAKYEGDDRILVLPLAEFAAARLAVLDATLAAIKAQA